MQTRAQPMSAPAPSARLVVARRTGPTVPRWALAAAGYTLLIVAWAFASPVGAAPDEAAHATRAAGTDLGNWQGTPVTPYQRSSTWTPARAGLLNMLAQEFTIPAQLAQPDPCFAGRTDESAACVNAQPAPGGAGTVSAATYETTAPPGTYAVAGLAMRLPQPVLAPAYLGRLALGLVSALLLAAAAWAAGIRGSLWPQAGLALAVTPTVVFLGSALGPQGVTIAAAICFVTAVGAFWTGPPRWGLASLIAVSAAVLALAAAAGAVYLALLVVVGLPLVQPGRLVRPASLFGIALVALAAAGGVVWALDHRALPAGHADVADSLATVLRSVPALAQQAVGVFGWSDVSLPLVAYAAWEGLAAIVVGAALLLGRWRDRIGLALAAAGALAFGAAAQAVVLGPVGWDLQGRYLLPVLAAAPIVAGFVLRSARVYPRADAFVMGGVLAGVQLVAFWENARRFAVGRHGPLSFVDAAQWAPPGGWTPWVVLAAVGAALVAASLAPLTRAERDEDEWGPLIVVDPATTVSR